MKLDLIRYNHREDSTNGMLLVDGKFECYTLEDERRAVKVSGETAIPHGHYKIQARRDITPLTKSYRNRYDFFDYHFEIMDVPNFERIYIHVGNWDEDTEGCILVGKGAEDDYIGQSSLAFSSLYRKMKSARDAGEDISIEIHNIEDLVQPDC